MHVDDDQSMLEISKQILMDMERSFDIDHASCVDEAFSKLATGSYDVVVSDYEMPQKDGLHFLTELREQNNEIPFILFTGKGREEVAIKALNLGANYYLNKAGGPETMYGELTHAIESAVRSVRVELAFKASEERFRAVFERASDGILAVDTETKRFVLANPKMCDLTGYSLDELSKLGVDYIHPKKDLPHVLDEFGKQLNGETTLALDIPVLKKDGQIVYCDVNSMLIRLENRKVMGGFFRDTTERKKAEEKTAKDQEELDTIINSSPIIIFYKDKEGKFLRVNKAFAGRFKYLGKGSWEKQFLTFSQPRLRKT